MTEFILNLIVGGGYAGIFLLMVAENIFPPIPSEVIMGLGGMAVAHGDMSLLPLIVIATLGTTIGNCFWFWLGWRIGHERFRPLVERYGRWLTLDWQEVERLHDFFVRHGHWVIFVCRFLPISRTLISLPAGMTRMPIWKFLIWTFAGSAIWISLLAGAGQWVGANFSQVEQYVGPVAAGLMVAMVLWYIYRVFTWRPRS